MSEGKLAIAALFATNIVENGRWQIDDTGPGAMGTNRPMARVPAGLRGQRGSAGPAGPPEFPGATGSVGSNGVSAVLGDSKGQWAFPMQLDIERVARNVVGVIRHMLIQHGSLKPMAQPLVLPSKPKKEVNLVTCQGLHTGRATRAGSRTAPGLVWAPGPVTRPRPGGRPPKVFRTDVA